MPRYSFTGEFYQNSQRTTHSNVIQLFQETGRIIPRLILEGQPNFDMTRTEENYKPLLIISRYKNLKNKYEQTKPNSKLNR